MLEGLRGLDMYVLGIPWDLGFRVQVGGGLGLRVYGLGS